MIIYSFPRFKSNSKYLIINFIIYFFFIIMIKQCNNGCWLQRVNRSNTACRRYSGHRIPFWGNTSTASATHWIFHIWKPGWTWTQRRKSSASISIPHKVCSTPLIRISWSFSTGPRSPLSTRTIMVSISFIISHLNYSHETWNYFILGFLTYSSSFD